MWQIQQGLNQGQIQDFLRGGAKPISGSLKQLEAIGFLKCQNLRFIAKEDQCIHMSYKFCTGKEF